MSPLLLKLRGVNWWRVSSLGLVALIILMFFYVRVQRILLEKAQVVASHPMVIAQTRYVRVKGPVQVVTKTIIKPGETIVEKVYVRGPVIENSDGWQLEKPLFKEAQEKPPKRWFAGLGVLGLQSADRTGMFYGGVTLFDRVDVGAGVTTKADLMVLGAFRF